MNDSCFGCIVCCLQLWNVDDVSTHASCSNETAIGEVLELLAMHIGSFLLLTSPVCTGRLGAVVGAVEIGGHDLAVMVNLSVQHRSLGPGYPGVGNEDVEAAIELLDNLID